MKNHYSIQLWCAIKCRLCMSLGTASSMAGPRNSKANPHQYVWSLVSGAGLIHCNFWTPTKPLPLRTTLNKSRRCTRNCSTHSQSESVNRKGLALYNVQPHNFKSWMNRAGKFCLIHHLQLISSDLQTSWLFSQRKHFHCQQVAENAEHRVESTGIHIFLIGKNVCNVSRID